MDMGMQFKSMIAGIGADRAPFFDSQTRAVSSLDQHFVASGKLMVSVWEGASINCKDIDIEESDGGNLAGKRGSTTRITFLVETRRSISDRPMDNNSQGIFRHQQSLP